MTLPAERVSTPARGVGAVIVASVLFGTTGTAQALGPTSTTPLTVGAARLAIGGLTLVVVAVVLGGGAGRLTRCARRPAVVPLVLGIAAYQPAFFLGVDRLGVGTGTLVALGSGPLWTGAMSWLIDRRRPVAMWWIATPLAVVGLVLLTTGRDTGLDAIGSVAALTAGAAYGAYTVASSHLVRAGDRPLDVMAVGFGIAGVLAVPLLLTGQAAWITTPDGLALALWLGLLPTAAAYVLFGSALRVLPAATVATLTLVEPVVATTLGLVVLDEVASLRFVLGTVLVLGAVLLLVRSSMRPDGQGQPVPRPVPGRGQGLGDQP